MENAMNRGLAIAVAFFLASVLRADDKPTPQQVFVKRILPIFNSPNPSSCVQCHLSGVDLKNYILPSHEKTFVSLRDQGLIDLDKPTDSRILKLINMREEDRKGAELIHEKVRKAEYDAFVEWIKACCTDAKLREAPKLAADDLAKPSRPSEVIRHSRKDRLLESFEQNIWAMRFRCMGCHAEGTPQCDKNVKEHSARVAWMKKEGAEATMKYLIKDAKLLDMKEPEKSLLLQKPLAAVKHGGGVKFLEGDLGYQAFRAWLEDYAAIVNDKYAKIADVPKKTDDLERFGTDIWLKLENTPPEWGDKLLRVTLYAWDADKKRWENESIAFSDRGVWGKGKLWQHNLVLCAPKEGKRAERWKKEASLSAGKYLVKIHVDFKGRLAKDWKAMLGEDEYAGQAEFESNWPEGYGKMTVVDANKVRR
jgi:hypothetical protein